MIGKRFHDLMPAIFGNVCQQILTNWYHFLTQRTIKSGRRGFHFFLCLLELTLSGKFMGSLYHFNIHRRVNSLIYHLCPYMSLVLAAQHVFVSFTFSTNLPFRAVRLFQSLLSHGGLAIIRPVRSDTLTLSPFSVYRYDTSVGLLQSGKIEGLKFY